ncbi:MAG TPA: hypothetical protein VNL38_00345 [Candidatus Nitrosotenuis sp.]|nr:hypothetical protein [Candidatus Nitrosotenuis sp.]
MRLTKLNVFLLSVVSVSAAFGAVFAIIKLLAQLSESGIIEGIIIAVSLTLILPGAILSVPLFGLNHGGEGFIIAIVFNWVFWVLLVWNLLDRRRRAK